MPQQLKRLVLVFALIIGGFLAARHFLVPPTFGTLGHYRAAAIDSVASLPIHYAGAQACVECHDDVVAIKARSRHASVACEVCHGAAAKHADNPDSGLPPAPRERDRCPLCHGYTPSRPTGFPQIDPATHNPGDPCIDCHEPHQPVTPNVPEQCSACHGQIARTKAVSPHAPLACVRCHLVAGAFILASLERVFNVKEVQPTYRLALLTALSFLIVAPLPLLAHLGIRSASTRS